MHTYRAKVKRVVDGDTVDFDVDLGFHISISIRTRLLGVDTPERGHQDFAKATNVLIDLLSTRTNEEGYIMIKTEKTGPLPQNVKYTCLPARASTALTEEEQKAELFDLSRIYKRQTYEEQKKWMLENTALFASSTGDDFVPTETAEDLD